jgi:hypothetical protein
MNGPSSSIYFALVRAVVLFLFLTLHAWSFGQVVINELQAANRNTYIAPDGSTPDWIEIFNSGTEPVDLKGMRFAVVGRQHIMESLVVVPGEHRLLWFDGHPELGAEHMGYSLPRKGGTLLLIAADGVTIQDVFTYPAMAGDLSVGRLRDGIRDWTFFTCATPGLPNDGTVIVQGRTRTPERDSVLSQFGEQELLALISEEDAIIRYTLDGTEPTETHGNVYVEAITIDRDLVIRARGFLPNKLPSKEFCETYMLDGTAKEGITIAMDQNGLSADSTGINVEGALANFSRRGRTWERLAMVKFNGTEDIPIPIGISIHGSGSRSLPKRSFKLHARDRYDSPVKGLRLQGEEHFQEGILRADAGAHTFLRNRFMELVVKNNDLNVDVQPSLPMPLYLNGSYWGMYRWMPPKDAQWLERISGSNAVDVLEGPAAVVRSGSDAAFKPAMEHLFAGAPLDSIARSIDVANLIDLACLDLYTGRADHDLNVRCYRPRPDGRWRWVLFDMDLWAPYNENSVERMASASGSETPFIPQLLQQPELRGALLARMTALLATALSPSHAQALADSLFIASREDLLADHARWNAEMERPHPDTCYTTLSGFIQQRPSNLIEFLAGSTGLRIRTLIVEVPDPTDGVVLLEGLELDPGEQRITCFHGVPLSFEARPAEGVMFTGWKGADSDLPMIQVEPSRTLRPLFAPMVP